MRKIALLLLAVLVLNIIACSPPIKDDNIVDPEGNPSGKQDPTAGNADQTVDREGLLQVIVMAEDWTISLRQLFALVDRSAWAGQMDKEELREVAVKSIEACDKYVSKHQSTELKQEYITVRAELINLMNDAKSSLQELISAIDNKDLVAVYNLRATFMEQRKKALATQTYYTDYLTERVHLLPETHYPPLAKEYYLTLIGFEDMVWIQNYIKVKSEEGRRPFSLEKLKSHAERVLPQVEALYHNHRFLNVPQRFGSRNYETIVDFSAWHLDSLRNLITAIEMNDLEAVDDALECIQLAHRRLNSEIRPFI